MSHLVRGLFLIGLLATTGCQPPTAVKGTPANQGPPPPPGATATSSNSAVPTLTGNKSAALLDAYRAAHASHDVDAMLKLYYFGNADAEMRQTIRENVEGELRCPLTEIRVESVAPGTYGPTVEGGIHWRPSLEVVALATANFDTSKAPPGELATQQMQLTVGESGGRYYFTVPLRE